MSEPAGAAVFLSGSDAALLAGATTGGTVDEEPAGGLPAGAVVGALSFGADIAIGGFRSEARRCRRIDIAENDRQAVFAVADDHDLGIRGLRERKRSLDAAPAQVRIRNPWLTVCWKAAMPFASICLRFDSSCLALDADSDTPESGRIARSGD